MGFTIDGVDFTTADGMGSKRSSGGLLLLKPQWMIDRYRELAERVEADNIFELGIYQGGSTAFLAMLFKPARLVAVDLRADPVAALDAFPTIHPFYGIDQSDRDAIEQLVDGPLDLVVDDASHRYEPTLASFNVLFPRLRPGGVFVLEDWSWEHRLDAAMAAADPAAVARAIGDTQPSVPLSRLVLELVLTTAFAPDIISGIVDLRPGWIVVERGDRPLDGSFDLNTSYGPLGRTLLTT